MGLMDLRLYEFDAAITALQYVIEENIDMDTGEYIGVLPIEELIQEKVNMEQARDAKLLSLGKLVLHYKKLANDHQELKKLHAKKEAAAEGIADRLREYIKANTPAGVKLKDPQVSMYEHFSVRVQPRYDAKAMPPAYRRPLLTKDFPRDLADRINNSCIAKDLPAPFDWEHDKEALKAAAKDCEKNGVEFDLAVLEKSRTVVVR
jgi:hypothetical protein